MNKIIEKFIQENKVFLDNKKTKKEKIIACFYETISEAVLKDAEELGITVRMQNLETINFLKDNSVTSYSIKVCGYDQDNIFFKVQTNNNTFKKLSNEVLIEACWGILGLRFGINNENILEQYKQQKNENLEKRK